MQCYFFCHCRIARDSSTTEATKTPALRNRSSAVDDNRMSGYVPGSRRGEKYRHALQLALAPNAAHRHRGLDLRLGRSKNLLRHSRRKDTRRNCVNSNPASRPLRCKLASHRDHPALRGNIADDVLALLGRTDEACNGGHVDNVATPTFEHLAAGTLREEKGAGQVNLKDHVPLLDGMFLDRLSPGHA